MTGNKFVGVAALCASLFVALPNLPTYAQVTQPIAAPKASAPPELTLHYEQINGSLDNAALMGTADKPVILIYGGEMTLQADQVTGDLLHQNYVAKGHVAAHEADTTLKAESLHVDGPAGQGEALSAFLAQRPYVIRAKRLAASATSLEAYDARFTTAPPGTSPDYEIRASRISIYPDKHVAIVRSGALYLFHTRLFSIPHLRFGIGTGARGGGAGGVLPITVLPGTSKLDGFYLAIMGQTVGTPTKYGLTIPSKRNVQAYFSTQQTILPRPKRASTDQVIAPKKNYLETIRQFATAPRERLPDGDPLLFHDFLPDRNPIDLFGNPGMGYLDVTEAVGLHIPSSGRRRDDLLVSRLPEVGLIGVLPLNSYPKLAVEGDPVAFRKRMRHLAFYATGNLTFGDYREQPDNIHETRRQSTLGLQTWPLLIAPNTVFVPAVSITTRSYSGNKTAYRYTQFAFAVNHYFTDRSAAGLQVLASDVSGDSPFNFDALDTSREIDGRLQLGNRRLAVATKVRYDLTKHGVIDYQIAIAPGLNGLVPIFSYNFRSRSVGLGLEIEGLSF